MVPTFETVLERVKEGPFQYLLFLCCSSWGFFGGMQVILSAFLVPAQVQYQCYVQELNATGWSMEHQRNFSIPFINGNYSQCLQYKKNYSSFLNMSFEEAIYVTKLEENSSLVEPCVRWKYDRSSFTRTLISDYDLVCDKFYLRSFVQGAFMLGVLVASPVGGIWADTSGRLPVIWVSLIGFLSVGILICFVNNFMIFLVARFIVGFFGHCLYQTSYILVVEWSLTRHRSAFGIIFSLPFALGYMLLPCIAYFNRDYVILLLALGCFAFCLVVSVLIMTESPRWSIQHGKTKQAVKAVEKACRLNKQTPIEKTWLLETFAIIKKSPEEPQIAFSKSKHKKCCFSNCVKFNMKSHPLFVSFKLQKYTAILTTNWIISTMVYYGLALNSGSFNFDPFLYIFLSGVMELPAYTVIIPIVAKYGRKATVIIAYVTCGIFLLVALCLPRDITFWASLSLNMAGKLSITCAFQILFLYTSEIYPTSVRTQGVGITMMIGRLGAIAAPFIIDHFGAAFWGLPNIIFGGASIFAGLITFLLPETYKQNLPETTEDVENWSKDAKETISDLCLPLNEEAVREDSNDERCKMEVSTTNINNKNISDSS